MFTCRKKADFHFGIKLVDVGINHWKQTKTLNIMALVKFNHGQNNVDNLFDSLLNDVFETPQVKRFVPSTDVFELEDQYILELALPGVAKDQIEINIDNDRLNIKGKRSEKELQEGEKLVKQEIRKGDFERNFYLPEDVVADKIKADYELGILTITIPKDEKKNIKRTIQVK
jgi:HSP20 family protein